MPLRAGIHLTPPRVNVRCLTPGRRCHREVRAVLRDPGGPPVDSGEGAPGLQGHPRAGGPGRPDGLPRVLDRRTPLPRGVLALLEPRGALRRGRGAHQEHPHRLRRTAAAQAVQPPDPHRGVGRGARPHLRRTGRLRYRTLVDPGRARGLQRRTRRHARDVAGGARAHRRRVDRRRVPGAGRVLADGRTSPRAAQAAAAATPADLRRHQQPPRPRGDRSARHRVVLVHRRTPARAAGREHRHVPQGARRVRATGGQVRQRHRRDVHDGVVRARPTRRPPRWPASRSSGTRSTAAA